MKKRCNDTPLQALLLEQLSVLDARARRASVQLLTTRIEATYGNKTPAVGAVVVELVAAAAAAQGQIKALDLDRAHLMVEFRGAATPQVARRVLLRALQSRARTEKALREDTKALDRYLDHEAVQERLAVAISEQVDTVEVAYRCAAGLARHIAGTPELLDAFGSGRTVETAFHHASAGGRDAVRLPALKFLTSLLGSLPVHERLRNLGAARLEMTRGWARGTDCAKFVQVAALELLCQVAPADAATPLSATLNERQGKDGPIIRRNALRICSELDIEEEPFVAMVTAAADDPSEYVRQQLCETLSISGYFVGTRLLITLCAQDPSPRVRGVAMRYLATRALLHRDVLGDAEDVIEAGLRTGQHTLDRQVALEAVGRLCLGAHSASEKARFVEALVDLASRFDHAPQEANSAMALLRQLEAESAPLIQQTRDRFAAVLSTLPEGRCKKVQLDEPLPLRDLELALSTAAAGDLTVSLRRRGERSVQIRRGEPRRLRIWRVLHELSRFAPDKRKAYPHTYGRAHEAGSVVPSTLLSEVTRTRVPGERRLHPQLGGWGHFIPRVDDFLSATRLLARPLRMVTALGVLTIAAPPSLLKRLRLQLKLVLNYAKFDDLRERSLAASDDGQRRKFIDAMHSLGFSVAIGHQHGQVADTPFAIPLPRAARYLGGAFAIPDLRPYWEGPLIYVLSPTGNTPFHLAVVVWLVLAGFLIRAALVMASIERARAAIPISIGGWGTRGKSGTERLKAALFHALRYDVVVKTTGCEAMFIHARRDQPAREIFLYRPYDKATIWEQRKVLEYGYRLKAQVFLWECMALNPHFVEVLNRDWMQDEVTTLTNAYPDHEDIMGPSGEDVARVIGLFTPKHGVTYTSEEQMLPILRELAQARGATLVPVSTLDADLLPEDMLARFPYDEHPRNIKLVMRLAEHYGVDQEVALVEMGDGVVPDLGVLKTYPTAPYRSRHMQFSNGMSANERAGFLSNWARLGFDQIDRDKTPGVVSVAVINNRADRVARSRVFSEILARDVNVTHMVLIGTNLSGMQQFVGEAVSAHFGKLALNVDAGSTSAMESFDGWLQHAGMPTGDHTLGTQIEIMLSSVTDQATAQAIVGLEPVGAAINAGDSTLQDKLLNGLQTHDVPDTALRQEVLQHAERLRDRKVRAQQARKDIGVAVEQGDVERANQIARQTAVALSLERVHVLEQASAKGDQVIDFMATCIEPGHHARVLGCQNIKGTGLDFVYRWLSLQTVTDALDEAEQRPEVRAERLAFLSTYTDYGLIDCQLALRNVRQWQQSDDRGWSVHSALLQSVESTLQQLEAKKIQGLAASGTKAGLWERFLTQNIEPLLDHWDSTRRTNLSEAVARDLFSMRVGQGRAALLLRELVARQKGGWLHKELRRKFRREDSRRRRRR